MSQSRTRKSTRKDNSPKDAEQSPQHSHHKRKIPKSVRYDLESTLLELCDVWFQDIKPHLVKNNIKVHVNERCQRQAVGSGTCNHLNPGADRARRRPPNVNFVNCYSTPTTASKAQCPRQRAPALPPDSQPPLNVPKQAVASSGRCAVACSELVPGHRVRSPPRPALPLPRSAVTRPAAARHPTRIPRHNLETALPLKHHPPQTTQRNENSGKSNFKQNKIFQNKANICPAIAEIPRRFATEQPQRRSGHKLFKSNNNVDRKKSLPASKHSCYPLSNSNTKRILRRELKENSGKKDERDKNRIKTNRRRKSENALIQRERDRTMVQVKKEIRRVVVSSKRNNKMEDSTRPPWR